MCLEDSNVKEDFFWNLEVKITLKFTLNFLKVTSAPSVENLKICMTEKYQFEDSAQHVRGGLERKCVSQWRENVLPQHYKRVPAREEP